MSNEKNATVNENTAENAQEQEVKETKKKVEKITWKVGPMSLDVNPTVAKVLKFVGIGAVIVGAGAIGSKIGGVTVGKKKDSVIDSQVAEISRLNALLDEAPKLIESTAETVTEAVSEVAEAVAE